ncbi:MAG: AAA family ATPase [Clostridia bacterium]|nr:AAA family ATPase [Clostridia bacterium]
MNINEAKKQIKDTVKIYLQKTDGEYDIPLERQRPVLLIGAPGIGKTAIMSKIAEELGIGFLGYTITHHTRQSAIGLPYITKKTFGGKEYSVTEYTMSEIVASVYEAMEKQGKDRGILFIDEINCVSETLAPAMLELLQHKKFGPHSIPDGWVLTAAGNPDEYNKSVNELDMVTLDRVKKIIVEPDYAAFREYAVNNGIHEAISCFLALDNTNLFKAERIAGGYEFVTPRGWEDLSCAISEYEKLNLTVDRDLISEYVQSPSVAAAFYRYYTMFSKYREIYEDEKVESGEVKSADLSSVGFEGKFAVAEILRFKACNIAERAVISANAAETAAKVIAELVGGETAEERAVKMEEEVYSSTTSARKKAVYKSVIAILRDKERPLDEYLKEAFENGKKDSERIANILRFAENSLGKKQELTAAVMGMVASESFVEFLTKFGCDEFYRINSELLIGGADELKRRATEALKAYKEN